MTTTGDPLAGPAVKPQAFRTGRAPGLPPGSSVILLRARQIVEVTPELELREDGKPHCWPGR